MVVGGEIVLAAIEERELRLERARTTKDVDLRVVGSPDAILAKLQEAARRDLADFEDER